MADILAPTPGGLAVGCSTAPTAGAVVARAGRVVGSTKQSDRPAVRQADGNVGWKGGRRDGWVREDQCVLSGVEKTME